MLLGSCNKETQDIKMVRVSDKIVKEMNTYNVDVSQIETLVTSFQKEKIAYQNQVNGEKTLIVIDDKPIDLALFQIEAVLNYERGNITDTTLKYSKTDSSEFVIMAKGYDALGKVLLDAEDIMKKYSDMEAFALANSQGEELVYVNITLEKVENFLAYFKVEKEVGLKDVLVLGEDYFPPTQTSVLAVDDFLCNNTTQTPKSGIELIDSKIFSTTGLYQACPNGGDVILYNIGTGHISYDGWDTDPIYGFGQWYTKGLMYFKEDYGGWPNTCMDYNELNKYLNGARYIYQTLTNNCPSNTKILSWHLEGGKGEVHLTTPWLYQVYTWVKFTGANWYCANMPY